MCWLNQCFSNKLEYPLKHIELAFDLGKKENNFIVEIACRFYTYVANKREQQVAWVYRMNSLALHNRQHDTS